MPALTVDIIKTEARHFSNVESTHPEPSLFGVTDGKAIGTYLEQKFRAYLKTRFTFEEGNSAVGIDFPGLAVDVKVTSIRQPQSSCPFTSARQKIFGLGYSLLVFVYDKADDATTHTATLKMTNTIFVDAERTADYQTTTGILQILDNNGNEDDLVGFLEDRKLPADEIEMRRIAAELLRTKPLQGYLTISNALQWRLQYKRVIDQANHADGLHLLYRTGLANE